MEQNQIEDAAMFLLHLRTQRDQVSGLPGELAPNTIEDAYAIQDALHRFAGWPVNLIKVGCTSELARQALGIPHPIGGRVPDEGVFADGETVPRAFLAGAPMLECEIALRVGPDGAPDAIAPAIELVNPRFKDVSRVSGASLIADNSAGCGAVLGTSIDLEDDADLADLVISLRAGDEEIAAGSTEALDGGPLASYQWALDHEREHGRSVEPGTWVITGTCSGLTPTEFGATYSADFGWIGSVTFTLGA